MPSVARQLSVHSVVVCTNEASWVVKNQSGLLSSLFRLDEPILLVGKFSNCTNSNFPLLRATTNVLPSAIDNRLIVEFCSKLNPFLFDWLAVIADGQCHHSCACNWCLHCNCHCDSRYHRDRSLSANRGIIAIALGTCSRFLEIQQNHRLLL